MDLFYSNLARQIPAGTAPTNDLIDGAIVQTSTQSFDDNGEADLDLQYAIALGKSKFYLFQRFSQKLRHTQFTHKRLHYTRLVTWLKELHSITSWTLLMLLTALPEVEIIQISK
jgi:hypothetical protein